VLSSITVHPVQFLAKLGRYLAVSLIGTATTLILLGILVGWVDFSPGWSNLIASGFSTALSFELDLRWVWRRHRRPRFVGQILPFWVWSLSELTLATLAVSWVGRETVAAHWQHSRVTEIVELTSIGISLLTWCVQYFLFDRIVFKDAGAPAAGEGPAGVAAETSPAPGATQASDADGTAGRIARRRIGPKADIGSSGRNTGAGRAQA
jgi:putative flippase GtrA